MAVQLRLEAASAARPGAAATAVAWIYNTGQVVQTYHLELVGRPESWATIDPSSVPLMPGDAGTATINVPVYDTADAGNGAKQIDTLYVGGTANWFVGQQWRSRYTSGPYTNRWWAFTLGDNGRWGWVPQVFFSGGANDERDAGLHLCGAQRNTCSP